MDQIDNHNLEEEKHFNFGEHSYSNADDHVNFFLSDHSHDELHEHQNYLPKDSILFDDDDSFDEDERLFDQQQNQATVASIQENINQVIEKSKKRTLTYKELRLRREAKLKRLLQLDEARTVLLCYFARAFTFNSILFKPLNAALLLSYIPLEYHKFMSQNLTSKQSFTKEMEFLVAYFTDQFLANMDPTKESILNKHDNLTAHIVRREKFCKVEYLILFAMFLNMHRLMVRVNFIIDISLMENNKQIKVSRKKTGGKKEDVYDYKKHMQAQTKKRKHGDFFAEKQLSKKLQSDTEEDVSEERKDRKLRIIDTILNSASEPDTTPKGEEIKKDDKRDSKTVIDYLDSFAFSKGKSSVQRPSQVYKRTQNTNSSTQDDNLQSSHLFIKSQFPQSQGTSELKQVSKEEEGTIHSGKNSRDQDIEETFSENIFIEVYNESSHKWLIICPLTNTVYTSQTQVQKYFSDQKILYVLSTQPYHSYETKINDLEANNTLFFRDIGANYVDQKSIKSYLKSKYSCILTRSVDDYLHKFAPYLSGYADQKTKRVVKLEQTHIEQVEMSYIPQGLSEFKNNRFYCLPSLIRKYEGFLPKAQPLPDKTFKGEPIFLRKDVTILHTDERWIRHRRQVKAGEQPIKRVKGMFNDPEKLAELYGFWQTEPYRTKLTEDGKIPMNKYGNFEIMNSELPEQCVHVDVPKAKMICKKLGFEYVEAVVGFEKGGNGKSHPCISGVVTFKENKSAILKEYRRLKAQEKEKAQIKIEKEAKQIWKKLLRSILVKKYIASMYDQS